MCNVGEGWKVSGQLNKHGNGLLVMTSSAVDEFGGGVLQKKLMSCVNLELYKQKSIKEWRLGADLSPHVGPQPQSWRRGYIVLKLINLSFAVIILFILLLLFSLSALSLMHSWSASRLFLDEYTNHCGAS